ncbi:hypothetical protein LOTGIDRAFT_230099 [Lottia gigantea]|uniref:Large ribosomal subunit protein bL27m n=1 Tax=Lottia gigantea TaxID=225164 RepID=V4B0P9_LOTGI|nr:hypothetical protein LOTGIDRAFT_230099 [Lottia gigantea]ESP03768.1 hypothetical protein LOTGIDRAFT_230099 [Lottia gigantea]
MAASMLKNIFSQTSNFIAKQVYNPIAAAGQLRFAKRKSMSVSKNTRGKARGKGYGWKKQDGDFVHAGEILVKQRGLRYYPGENVKLQKYKSLEAMCDGVVMITSEKLSPLPNSPLHDIVQSGTVINKKFYHVYRTPLHAKFKLVDEV